MAKFGQELKCGILIKIRMVWLLFETSRNLRNLSCNRQNIHFSVFFGVFQKRALGNVKVEVSWPKLVRNSNLVF